MVVVSGLARGIDTVAHQTAIQRGGETIAVIGTPLDKSYPAENRSLQEQIANNYLLISQFPIGIATGKYSFPQRNRTMALLSDATVIVEAGETSGSLSQGWEALRLGRPLLLMKSLFENPSLKWPREMEKFGARVLANENLTEILEDISPRFSSVSFDELNV